MTTQHFRACTLCEAMCGVVIETEGRAVVQIRGDQADPFSRGHICPKAMGLADLHHDPDRLRTPLRREGARFVPIGWDEAFDRVAENLKRVQFAHGKDAVAVYQGNPSVHNLGTMLMSPQFVHALGTRSRFSATSVDQLPHMLTALLMFGHQLLMPVPDIDRTDHMLILGANPAVSNGSLMTAPGAANRLKAIIARGGKVVVLDPRRTETAAFASEHVFIRPGSDALFLLSVLHTLFAEKLTRPSALTPLLDGFEKLAPMVQSFSPERVTDATGVAADTIRRLARELAGAERGVCYGRMGVSTQDFGTLCCWLINLINIATGNLDREGGSMFTEPAVDLLRLGGALARGKFGTYKSRVRGLPEFGGELPTATLAEEIETEGKQQIRALVTSAGNPVLSTPNGTRLERALAKLDFMVSIDFYLNETTRHAHIILPPTGPLEHDHYDLALHILAVRNTAKYSPATFEREPTARHDFEIFNELMLRLARGPLEKVAARARYAALSRLGAAGFVDLLLRVSAYGEKVKRGLSLRKLRENPHGIDLGALRPCLADRLGKRHPKVVLVPELMQRDLVRLTGTLTVPRPALVLIGRRHLRSNNSWLHNSARLIKGRARCTLQMHPKDAAQRGLSQGSAVEVRSKIGAVEVPLEISDALMEGVVSLPHGFGHTRQGTTQHIASAHAGASINDITDESRVDQLSGNASFSGVPVEVSAVAGSEAVGQ